MYHYLGSFHLYETSRSINSYHSRCPCKIGNAYYDSLIELINQSELAPSKSVEVQISFLSIDLVAPLIKVGGIYQVCEGSRPIGDVIILHDPWDKVEQWIAEGEIRKAVVGQIDWTTAGILIEGDIQSILTSQDMGLQAWAEISQVLKSGEMVKVRIERIDKIDRQIKVSFVGKIA